MILIQLLINKQNMSKIRIITNSKFTDLEFQTFYQNQ